MSSSPTKRRSSWPTTASARVEGLQQVLRSDSSCSRARLRALLKYYRYPVSWWDAHFSFGTVSHRVKLCHIRFALCFAPRHKTFSESDAVSHSPAQT